MFNEAINNLPTIFQNSTRAIYSNEGFKGPCNTLAKTIWDNEGIEMILAQLAECLHVDSYYTKNKFTPMTLAAIQGNLPVMAALKERGADLNLQDMQGYTALHHLAMLGNEVGVKTLLDWQASPLLRTNYGATFMDFLRFNAPFRNETIPLDPKLFSAHTNDHTKFDKACIPSDVEPVDEIVSTPAMLVGIYAREAYMAEVQAPSLMGQKTFLSLYDAFKKNPPKMAVKSVGNFCGLFAEQPIKKGEFFAEYTGSLTTEGYPTYQDAAYVWVDYPSIDAGSFRSAAAMANEGFPNTHVMPIARSKKGLDGLPNRKLLYALEDIQSGEEIRINYRSKHNLKWNSNYQDLGFEALQKYLTSHSWNDISKSVRSFTLGNLKPGASTYVDGISDTEKSLYILETPSVFQRLAKEGTITRKDLKKIRKLNQLFDQIDPDSQAHREQVLKLAIKTMKQRSKEEL